MKEILLATENLAKVRKLQSALGSDFIVKSLLDYDGVSQVEEIGASPVENALLKARACFTYTGKPCIGYDYGLYVEGLDGDEQPGTKVKRTVSRNLGKDVSDEDVISFYTNIANKFGGSAKAEGVRGLAFVSKDKEETIEIRIPLIIRGVASTKRELGFPLASVVFDPKFGKYNVELTSEEESLKEHNNAVVDFVLKHCRD